MQDESGSTDFPHHCHQPPPPPVESSELWAQWHLQWNHQNVAQMGVLVSNEIIEGATVIASSSGVSGVAYANEYGEKWFAEQLANIPMLIAGNGTDGRNDQIIQVDQNGANGEYVLVADRELAAILGGHVDRDTIYWLLANFKLERNAVMPRGFLYSKYEAFCTVHAKPLMNQACMGKTVRALFRGLETRRLGRRGKSRYHYIGLAINPEGEFAGMVPLEPEGPAPEPGDGERKRRRTVRTTLAAKKLFENPIGKHFEALDPESRIDAALDQLEKLLATRRNRVIIPTRLRGDLSSALPFRDGHMPEGLTKDYVIRLLCDLRIHLGLIGHSILSGVLLAIPSMLQNFWASQTASLQIPEHFSRTDFALALSWDPLVEYIGVCCVDLYGNVMKHLMPKTDKPLNSQTLDFLYEFAGKYGQWVKASTTHLNLDAQATLNGAAVSFCQTLKQVLVLNSALGLVELVERDRSKANVVAEGFKALSDRFVLVWNASSSKEQLALTAQTTTLMDFLAGHDYSLQRWRGWIRSIVDLKMRQVPKFGDAHGLTHEQIFQKKEQVLTDVRSVLLGLLVEMQKHVERSGKEYATPMTFVLSYYMHYANYALDHLQANLNRTSLLRLALKMAKSALLESGSLSSPPLPNYEITFFSQRLIPTLNINVFDFHYYGNFDELRNIIHLPNFEALLKQSAPAPAPVPALAPNMSFISTQGDYVDEATNSSILAEYLQQSGTGELMFQEPTQFDLDALVPIDLQEVETDGVVPDNDILLQDLL